MTRELRAALLALGGLLAVGGAAAAQEPAASFDALNGRIQVGQRIWVTDASGREVRGRLERISGDELVLRTDRRTTIPASDVRRVRTRDRDSVRNGTLVGLGIGAAMGTAWCVGAIADDSGDVNARVECAEGFIVYPGLGALIGVAVDAVIPGKMRVVYQASARQASRVSIRVVPLASSRAKGLAVSWSF